MGVLNVTPDSFSDGGVYLNPDRAIEHGLEMAAQGADWIDVGGESTRPGSKPIPAEEEFRRVLPVIRGLSSQLRKLRQRAAISIDTTKAEVAEQAVRAGASIINDVSGLRFDPRVADVARRHRTALVLMHLRGRPETMQQGPFARSIWRSLSRGLARSVRQALDCGVRAQPVECLDAVDARQLVIHQDDIRAVGACHVDGSRYMSALTVANSRLGLPSIR